MHAIISAQNKSSLTINHSRYILCCLQGKSSCTLVVALLCCTESSMLSHGICICSACRRHKLFLCPVPTISWKLFVVDIWPKIYFKGINICASLERETTTKREYIDIHTWFLPCNTQVTCDVSLLCIGLHVEERVTQSMTDRKGTRATSRPKLAAVWQCIVLIVAVLPIFHRQASCADIQMEMDNREKSTKCGRFIPIPLINHTNNVINNLHIRNLQICGLVDTNT